MDAKRATEVREALLESWGKETGPVAILKDGSEPFVLSPAEPVEVQMRRLLAAR